MVEALDPISPLLGTIHRGGKTWITSNKFHEDFKPTGALKDTNESIRRMPTYGKLTETGHLLEVDSNYAKSVGGGVLPLLVKSNSYRPVMLIDPVAQKEIEHHFNVTTSTSPPNKTTTYVVPDFKYRLTGENMTESLAHNTFVRPHFIEELGEEGLTAADIAKSLGTEAVKVRRKLDERGFLDRIKSQGFQARPIGLLNENNGLEYTEYVLDVAAAKFFVGKYDSPQGDSYLGFLIRLERKVDELDEMTRSDPLLQQIAATQRLRVRQLQQEMRIEALEGRVDTVDDRLLDSILSVPQKRALKGLIDSRAITLGGAYLAGAIQKDLKSKFALNSTNDKWYHLRQGDFEAARDFVSNWGSDSFWENWK